VNESSGTRPDTPFRLLLVDDEEPILYAMEQYFQAIGCKVDCARGAVEAERLLAASDYSGAIVDLRLTASREAEGLGVVSAIRRHNPEARVILLTAYGSSEVEKEAVCRGAHSLFHKPASLPDIAGVMFGPAAMPGRGTQNGQGGH
jgi:ActR/RegA family two-component response regulator